MKLIKSIRVILVMLLITFVSSFSTATESEEKMEGGLGINISEGNMKHRGKLRMRKYKVGNENYASAPGTAVAPGASTGGVSDKVSTSGDLAKGSNLLQKATGGSQNSQSSQSSQSSGSDSDSLGEGPIFHTAWVKYFHYAEKEQNGDAPKHFFKNNQYYEQMKLFPAANTNSTSNDGLSTCNSYIKSPSHFYAVVFKNSINFISSRQRQLQKTYDVMNIEGIKPVQEGQGFGQSKGNNNGIQDFGSFNEGSCFKIVTTKPKPETWILCTDTDEEKSKFMQVIKKLKIQAQRDAGMINAPGMITNKKPDTISSLLAPPNSGSSQELKSDQEGNLGVTFDSSTQKITDGYWIVLQDWTQCSLKCGGGTSTLQRMCVPPKNGGAACDGEAIMTKPCNTQPCPQTEGTAENGKVGKAGTNMPSNVVLKPTIKVMPFSSRPQRYTKCVVKESDLMLTQDNQSDQSQNNNPYIKSSHPQVAKLQIPVRVVMNNRTVSIFGGEDYDSQILTFSIRETFFKTSSTNKNCFVLAENSKRAELCPFGFNTEGKSMIEEWDYDFNLFKHQCFLPRDKIEANLKSNKEMEDDLNKKLQDKIKNAKMEILEERQTALKKKVETDEEVQMENVIKKTNQVALQAIQKELNLEALIRQEEAEREKKEEILMLKKIEEEKTKSDCLLKAIKERQLESQLNLRAKEAEDEVQKIKKEATEQVSIRRSKLKEQIMQMRKKAQRRKAALAQQLHTVRLSMADTMSRAYKKGDGAKCKTAIENDNNRKTYCQANFAEDLTGFMNCKETEDFCMFCCETEFGDMFATERSNCYKTYCPKPNKPGEKGGDETKGRWIWQNEMK